MSNTSTFKTKYLIGVIFFSIISILILYFSIQPISLYLSGVRTHGVVEKIEPHNSRCTGWNAGKAIHNWYDCTIYSATIILSGLQTDLTRGIKSYKEKYGSSNLKIDGTPTYFLYSSSSVSGHDQSVELSIYHEGQEIEIIVDPSAMNDLVITNNIAIKENLIRGMSFLLALLGISISFLIFFFIKWSSLKKVQFSSLEDSDSEES